MEDPVEYIAVNKIPWRDAKANLEKNLIKWKEVDARVMDIGCGDGAVTSQLLKKHMPANFMKLVGCDINEKSVKYAQEHYGSEKVKFMTLNMEENIPDELKEGFDHVFSSYTFNWIRNQELGFRNVYDMLVKGGNCLILFLTRSNSCEMFVNLSQTPKWSSALKDVRTKFATPYYDSQDPASEIQALMKRIGFKDVDVRATQESYAFEDGIETFKNLMKCLNPFEGLKENWEEFMSNAIASDPGLGTVNYVLVVACGTK